MNDLRLLCTYLGPGTLSLPSDAIDEEVMRRNDHNKPVERDPSLIQQVATGHVAVIKGALYPKNGHDACVHRSPTIEETGTVRLLLRIATDQSLFDNLCSP